ncbi:sulfotransferase [Pseudaestuariivita rosea]|uniref:sulfotransferase n=1 Tax=Pseudaestuariivita rosea TaxID=2763263 RepID=UPI001ABA074B|nr:sulfotransferase [Pseudaestuariivita rosea]
MLNISTAQIPSSFKQALQLQKTGRLAEAEAIYKAILAIAPKLAEAHFQLGQIAQARRNTALALDHLTKAKALKPTEPAILMAEAALLASTDRETDALKSYDALINLAPKSIKPRADKALLLQRMGDFKAAEVEFKKALKLNPLDGDLYRTYLATKKLKPGDPLIATMKKAYQNPQVKGRSKTHLGFALAKAMEETGQTEKVFKYLTPANRAMAKAFPYDIAAREAEIDALIDSFQGFDFKPETKPDNSFAPIFVTGLPRSGTTLVEQIISSHPKVTAGGEMRHGLQLAYGLLQTSPTTFRPMADVKSNDIKTFATTYQDKLREQWDFDSHITDKSIQSHLIMGFLKYAIPSARIIVVRRDPRDIALSIYKNVFADGTHRYAYDLKHLARYIKASDKIIDFWREKWPECFHQINYEDLVSDPDSQIRNLIAAAGLDWDDACLDYSSNDRQVKTLSIHQVRQLIYTSSTRNWEKYRDDMQPFLDEWGDADVAG